MDANENYRERISFGTRLRDVRVSKGMTQTDLARLLGFAHAGSISGIERGRRLVYRDELPALAEALCCEIGELLEDLDCSSKAYPLERIILPLLQLHGGRTGR